MPPLTTVLKPMPALFVPCYIDFFNPFLGLVMDCLYLVTLTFWPLNGFPGLKVDHVYPKFGDPAVSIFTVRRYARMVYALVVCPSIRLSITSRHCTKMARRRITQTMPYDSPGL